MTLEGQVPCRAEADGPGTNDCNGLAQLRAPAGITSE